jgi:TatD DNase family protein
MTLLIDAHNHLQEEVLEPHLPAVLQRARAAGVTGQVVNGTHEGDWEQVRALAAAHPEVVPCFGLHPWFVGERQAGWCERLRELLGAVPAAVGEIGLDRWLERPNLAAQEEVFVAQLRLARELQRPVMIHCLRAWGWLREVLEREGPLPGLLIHAYGGAADMLAPLAAQGALFSFGGGVLDERKRRARLALQAVPLERLLIETDAPALLPPEPYRPHVTVGERGELLNEPANLPAILAGIAKLRGLPPDELAAITWENAGRLLGPLRPERTADE